MINAEPAFAKEDLSAVAKDFKASMKDVMSEAQIDKTLSEMASFTNQYAAQCQIASTIFYVFITPAVEGGQNGVDGHGGGLFTPGGGGSWGHLYTDDIERLYRDTISYQVNAAAAYLNVNFFDGHSNLLGHYHGGGVGTVVGIGGGTIRWR